jgi:beta propeller repeat protein
MYNLSTKKETLIPTHGLISGSSAIYGNRIIWMDENDDDDGNWNIYVYDTSTHNETQISADGSSSCIAIYGHRIVWEDGRNGNYDIYMYDLSTKKEKRITTSGSAFSPTIYDNRIVYMDSRNSANIYMYDLSTSKEIQITTSGSANYPAIHGNRVVWKDWRDGFDNIYMYDLTTSKETQITTFGSAYSPDIYGNKMVWMDGMDIYMYDISASKITKIITRGSADSPAIYGDKIVWQNYSNVTHEGSTTTYSDPDVYMGTLSYLPFAGFSASPTSGKVPLNVSLKDKSTGYPTKWKWTFGDGTNSTKQNPIHKYSKAGKYTVSLTVNNAAGSNTTTKTNYITVVAKPVAAFSASPTSGKLPLNVKFTDTSAGAPTTWKWNFGDGTTSTKQNPTHKYSKAGIYTVSLTVKNAAGSNTAIKAGYIKVIEKPTAGFSASPISGKAPLNVKFTDKSTGLPTKWKWSFGDGATSTKQNITHKYTAAGKYTVSLTVTNAAGSNTKTVSNYITVKK